MPMNLYGPYWRQQSPTQTLLAAGLQITTMEAHGKEPRVRERHAGSSRRHFVVAGRATPPEPVRAGSNR